MAQRCNKCGQADPHLGDSWCLGCSAVDELQSELKVSWGTEGTRALATEILVSAVRQIRGLRRLGLAGAGRARALTPEGGKGRGASVRRAPTPPAVPPAEPAPEETARGTEPPAETPVKTEDRGSESDEYEDYSDEEESEKEDLPQSGLKPVPKAAAERDERSEIPRRRTSEGSGPREAGSSRAPERSLREDRDYRERAPEGSADDRRTNTRGRHRDDFDRPREDRRRSRSRRRHHSGGQDGTGKRRRRRKGHRAGKKHQRLYHAEQEPFRRFHQRLPGSFWDQEPLPR